MHIFVRIYRDFNFFLYDPAPHVTQHPLKDTVINCR